MRMIPVERSDDSFIAERRRYRAPRAWWHRARGWPAAARQTKSRRGSVGVVGALAAVPLILVVGLAVDATRVWLVRARLQTALDAAALVAAREINVSAGTANSTALFWSNFGRTSKTDNTGYLGATATIPKVAKVDANTVTMTSQASVATTFLRLAGVGPVVVHASTTSQRAINGMELSLVLDITGSMATNNNIATLRQAATNLVNILYGSADTQQNLWVAVVPYVASVNLGNQHASWLTAGSLDQTAYQNASWMGCVEARANGNDSTDATPAAAPFTPFLWKSTLGKYFSGTKAVTGDNDWSATHITEAQQSSNGNSTVGPNLSCSATPVLPLTASKATVLASIAGLQATYRGGTFANLGMQAGWFTLSPKWRGWWGSPTLPLDYNTPFMTKVLVIMTDGTNTWFDWDGGAPGLAPTTYTGQKVDADYTAYGRLSENRIGITMPNTGNITNDLNTANARAKTQIDSRLSALCTTLKKSGITLYTITFGVSDSATQSLWQNCASKAENYFNSPTQAALQGAFQQIGTQLSNLRLAQ